MLIYTVFSSIKVFEKILCFKYFYRIGHFFVGELLGKNIWRLSLFVLEKNPMFLAENEIMKENEFLEVCFLILGFSSDFDVDE